MAYRYTFSLYLFGVIYILLFFWNYSKEVVDYERNEHIHHNLNINTQYSNAQNILYTRIEGENPKLKLSAQSINIRTKKPTNEEMVKFQYARGLFFQNNQDDMYFQADQVILKKASQSTKHTIIMNNTVKITFPHNEISSDTISYDPNTKHFSIRGNVSSTHHNPNKGDKLNINSQFGRGLAES